jgi:2-polyprenyl-3-methyl-5-hydroxy-6-metoxy-1,4-benzoquinol methylase
MTSDGRAIEPTTAEEIKDRVTRAFLEVKEQFPFPRYMDHKLYKCIAVSSALLSNGCRPGSRILSIGSGPCDCEGVLSKLGYNVNALDDLSDYWHLIGKNRERILAFAKKMGIEFTMQSLYEHEFRVGHFDAVLLLDVLEHLHRSPRELLNQAVSSLKPGGTLIVETPNAVMLANRLKVLFGKSSQAALDLVFWNIGEYRSHVREYTEYDARDYDLDS